MAPKRKYIKGWEWVRTEGVITMPGQERDPDAPPPDSGALAAVAIIGAFTLGAMGLMWVMNKQDQLASQPQAIYAAEQPVEQPPIEQPPQVRSVSLWVPKTLAQFEPVLNSARGWIRMAPRCSNAELAVLVWAECWRSVNYPGRPHPDDHPTVAEVHRVVDYALQVARTEFDAEREARGEPVFMDAPRAREVLDDVDTAVFDDAPTFAPGELDFGPTPEPEVVAPVVEMNPPVAGLDVVDPVIERMIHERPTPGHFYRIGDDVGDDGIEGLASLAVLAGLLEAAHAKSWSVERTMARANEVSESLQCVIDYESLIRQSEWNAHRLEPLCSGTVVWLPPIRRSGLLSRKRPPTVTLDPRPWSDGSSRLEPPPKARPPSAGGRHREDLRSAGS